MHEQDKYIEPAIIDIEAFMKKRGFGPVPNQDEPQYIGSLRMFYSFLLDLKGGTKSDEEVKKIRNDIYSVLSLIEARRYLSKIDDEEIDEMLKIWGNQFYDKTTREMFQHFKKDGLFY